MIKRVARPRLNLRSWGAGVVEETTVSHLHSLAGPWAHPQRLMDPRSPSAATKQVLRDLFPSASVNDIVVSRRAVCNNGTITVNDCVLWQTASGFAVGSLLLNAIVCDCHRAVVTRWQRVAVSADRASIQYSCTDVGFVIDASSVEAALLHRPSDDGKTNTVIVPFEYRDCDFA